MKKPGKSKLPGFAGGKPAKTVGSPPFAKKTPKTVKIARRGKKG